MYDGYLSVDLGQRRDWTATVFAEAAVWIGDRPELSFAPTQRELTAARMYDDAGAGWAAPSSLKAYQRPFFRDLTNSGVRPDRPPLLIRHLDRVREKPYTDVVNAIIALLDRPPLSEMDVALLVDAGGVGIGVLDFMRQRGLRPWSITATGGDHVNTPEYGVIRVPKREIVASAQVALAEGRLRIAGSLPHAATLRHELMNYQVRISAAGHDSYAAREGEHDDVLYAVAQACWFASWFSQNIDDAIAEQARVAVVE
jgi:hypothetical protein